MIRLNCFTSRYLLSFAKSKIFMLKRSSMKVVILICINSSVDPDFPFLVYSLQWHGKPLYLDQLLSKISLSIFLLIKKCSVKSNAIIRFHPSCLLSLQINPKLLGFGHFGNWDCEVESLILSCCTFVGGVYNMESSLLMLTHISALWLDSFINAALWVSSTSKNSLSISKCSLHSYISLFTNYFSIAFDSIFFVILNRWWPCNW